MHTWTHIHKNTHTYIQTYMQGYTHTYAYIHKYIRMYINTPVEIVLSYLVNNPKWITPVTRGVLASYVRNDKNKRTFGTNEKSKR